VGSARRSRRRTAGATPDPARTRASVHRTAPSSAHRRPPFHRPGHNLVTPGGCARPGVHRIMSPRTGRGGRWMGTRSERGGVFISGGPRTERTGARPPSPGHRPTLQPNPRR
jgi:hypothetical protein